MNPGNTPPVNPEEATMRRRENAARRLANLLDSARQQSGIRDEQLRSELRLPVTALAHIRSGDFEALGPEIYARGFVMGYARLVNAPLEQVQALWTESHEAGNQPELVSHMVKGPAWQQSVQRLATAVVAITVLVGPVLWLHSQGAFQQWLGQGEETGLASTAAVGGDAGADAALEGADARAAEPAPVLEVRENPVDPVASPVTASMASLPSGSGVSEATEEFDAAQATVAALVLEIYFRDDCWVEVSAADGERIEYDLVRANSRRRYEGTGPFSVFLGNAEAVTVAVNGEFLDITPWRRRNLARFDVALPEIPGVD